MFNTAVELHRSGELQRAEMLYREVLRQAPRHAEALNMLGVVGCQTGNAPAGAALIRRALEIDPGHPDFNNNLGMSLLEQRDPAGAVACFERAVAARPRFAEAHFNLANAALALKRFEDAEKHYRKALRARPDYADALNNLGNLLRRSNRPREAAQLFHKLVRQQPDFAPGHFNLALALQAQGTDEEALAACRRAVELDPKYGAAWEHLGHCERRRGALSDAASAYAKALETGGASASVYDALGLVRFAQGRITSARECFERGLALDGGAADIVDHLGMTWSAEGDRGRAEDCFERALDLDPAHGAAWRNLAELDHSAARRAELLARGRDALGDLPDGSPRRASLEFALGKLYDDAGEHAAAFAAFSRANAARRAVVGFDAAAQARFIDAIIDVFDRSRLERPIAAASDSERPVFVLGMPRSGTTLVEQILASHPDVHGAGELTFFPEHVPALGSGSGAAKAFPHCLRGTAESLGALAPAYLELLASHGGDARRVSDKMPYNFLYLGVIAVLFPRARVIHCRRDPMATCFSIFTRDLAGYHPYAYDLGDLAAAYAGYARLMAHWRAASPLRMLEVDYEVLVDDMARGAQRMIEFLDLAWDPVCLEFHRSGRPVSTASQWQVRRPVYASAKTHWRRYSPYLETLREGLQRRLPGGADAPS